MYNDGALTTADVDGKEGRGSLKRGRRREYEEKDSENLGHRRNVNE